MGVPRSPSVFFVIGAGFGVVDVDDRADSLGAPLFQLREGIVHEILSDSQAGFADELLGAILWQHADGEDLSVAVFYPRRVTAASHNAPRFPDITDSLWRSQN